jgi:ABC-type Zn uptake system ZnuABC Zn-binding protein ZnuA
VDVRKMGRPRFTAIGLLSGLVALCFLTGCAGKKEAAGGRQKLMAVCSINIIDDLVKNIGGDTVRTSAMITGLENPHTFAPTPADSKQLAQADVFFQIGLGLEPWAAGLLEASGNTKIRVVTLSDGLETLRAVRDADGEDEHQAEHGTREEETGVNPHVWMDPGNAAKMVDSIEKALAELDPARSEQFRANAAAYKKKLSALTSEFRSKAASLKMRRVATYAPSFSYLLHWLGIKEALTVQLACAEEPSARRMSRIIEEMKRSHDIKVLLTTPQYSDVIPRQIGHETGARLVYITPLLTDDSAGGTYLKMIQTDAEKVISALGSRSDDRG